jgi:hypothetical protein
MRNLLLGVLLLPALSWAEPVIVEKPVVCDDLETVVEGLQKGYYKEIPIWAGTDENSKYSLFVNEKTKTWTMIQFDRKTACIIGAGEEHKMIYLGPKI